MLLMYLTSEITIIGSMTSRRKLTNLSGTEIYCISRSLPVVSALFITCRKNIGIKLRIISSEYPTARIEAKSLAERTLKKPVYISK